MFERFTERARQVVVFAQEEARQLKQSYIGTEHLLLGLIREEEGVAARILVHLEVDLDHVRDLIIKTDGQEAEVLLGQIPFTPRAKKTLEVALREALALGHNYIGTEHVLAALVRNDTEAVSTRILVQEYGIDSDTVIEAIKTVLDRKPLGPNPTSPEGIQLRLDREIEKRNKQTLHIRRLRRQLRKAKGAASK